MLATLGGATSLDPIIEGYTVGKSTGSPANTIHSGGMLAARTQIVTADPRHRPGQERRIETRTHRESQQHRASGSIASEMNGIPTSGTPPGEMYVRALYDYDADDRTSLSFRQGDIIQVITQLESGWWDGIINDKRGWFPSNYCAVVRNSGEVGRDDRPIRDGDDADVESEDDYEERDYAEVDSEGNIRDDPSNLPIEGTAEGDQEEAAFWIPQATPDGRLFYFNTLTGVSTMELPLETPTSANESGPRDPSHLSMPEQTKLPAEVIAGGFEKDEDTDYENSASEIDGVGSRNYLPNGSGSYTSDGVSPATSIESMRASPIQSRQDGRDPNTASFSVIKNTMPRIGSTVTSFPHDPLTPPHTSVISGQFFDDTNAVPLTWNRLVEDMRRAVERYRQSINNSDRSEFVKRAEDISDHLRLLLAAGSGTTDNHSGNPSIISTNKALYPHFREMMSRFSKLVLSSHIAAADWPAPDSYSKCLQEADGVLNGVYGFVEVARQQRGEDIPRLTPGFVMGSKRGGNWQNNGLTGPEPPMSLSFIDHDDYDAPSTEATVRLDAALLESLDEFKQRIVSQMRRLHDLYQVREKVISPSKHRMIGDNLCKAAMGILELYKSWMASVESVDLAPLATGLQSPQLSDFAVHKQKLYDGISGFVIACQSVAAPLSDEWAELRGESLQDRLNFVAVTAHELEMSTSQIYLSLQMLSELLPQPSIITTTNNAPPKLNGGPLPELNGQRHASRHMQGEIVPQSRAGHIPKIIQVLGEVPAQMIPARETEEAPAYLRLDHESEIVYDERNPTQLKGGTLTALVEQLTRHDRRDPDFNNTFLLTYRSFTSASELFEMLVKRWSIQPPSGLTKEEYQSWLDLKQTPIRIRVVNILKSWFDNYWMEGNGDEARQLMQRVLDFGKETIATTGTTGAGPLITSIEQRLRGHDAKKMVPTPSTQAPAPILPRNMKKLRFLDIDATEFARQLTIMESRLYGKIKSTECLNKTWQKKLAPGEPDPAANVKALILHSNQLTNWVAQLILTQQDVKTRVRVIKHFVLVADKCRALNNFSTLTSIVCALDTAPIHRLGRTWAAVNPRTMSTVDSMRKLMRSTKNFPEYRLTLRHANPPCIPFLGVFLTDLTFIEDGMPSLLRKSNAINFSKRAKTAEVIHYIQQYQKTPYPLQPVPELQEYIIENMRSAGDVHEMYDWSLAVEPREREDEKIAR